MRYIILAIMFVLTGCAHQDEWTKQDTAMFIGASAAMVIDAVTTARIQYRPGIYEAGNIRYVLGSQPSTSDTYLFFGTLIISNYFITKALPAKWRPYWQGSVIAIHSYAVRNNCELDLC